jgi:hypothetical protein
MPVDVEQTERPEPKVYGMMKRNRHKAYTEEEIKESANVERLGSMHTYTSLKPYVWTRMYHDGETVYTLRLNHFAISIATVSLLLVVALVWLAVTNPSAFYTCGL